MEAVRPVVVYHNNCADGFAAAWVVWKAFDGRVELVPGTYQDAAAPWAEWYERTVYLVDFSYPPEVVETLLANGNGVTVIDHHKTAVERLAPLAGRPGFRLVADMESSGAALTWGRFFPDRPAPYALRVVEDRDLWRFALPGTRKIMAAIFSLPYDMSVWDELMSRPEQELFAELLPQGEAIERKHHKDIRELVEVCKRRMVIGGFDVPVASLPYTLSSDAGALMARGERFAACYWDTEATRVFSLRSTEGDPNAADVSEIAKLFGGGGHRHAAGFAVPRFNALAMA